MKIFINDIPFRIIPFTKEVRLSDYDHIVVDASINIDFDQFHDDVLIQHASIKVIDRFLQQLKVDPARKIDSITFQVDKFRESTDFFKKNYSIIEAAGGLVEKNGHVLMINRLGKWDLPKGKIDNGERIRDTAVREVMEECSITVSLGVKICHTWHTYKRNNNNILKKTSWYLMQCLDDSNMKPQIAENIDEIRWMTPREINQSLYNSYSSIRHVFRKYYKMKTGSDAVG